MLTNTIRPIQISMHWGDNCRGSCFLQHGCWHDLLNARLKDRVKIEILLPPNSSGKKKKPRSVNKLSKKQTSNQICFVYINYHRQTQWMFVLLFFFCTFCYYFGGVRQVFHSQFKWMIIVCGSAMHQSRWWLWWLWNKYSWSKKYYRRFTSVAQSVQGRENKLCFKPKQKIGVQTAAGNPLLAKSK